MNDRPIDELLRELHEDGFRISVSGDKLKVSAPKGRLTPQLREELAARKQEILAFARVEDLAASDVGPRPIPREGLLPLSFAQERAFFIHQLDPNPGVAPQLWIRMDFDSSVVCGALSALASRHEIMRTTYRAVDGELGQVIHADPMLDVSVVDLRDASENDAQSAVFRRARLELARPFDLEAHASWRAVVFEYPGGSSILIVTMHHIASDGWSLPRLGAEVRELCSAEAEGRPPQLPDLPIQYVDFAAWQRQRYQDPRFRDRLLDYWKEKLAGLPPALELPLDHPRPPTQTHVGAARKLHLDLELTEQVQALGRRERTTLFMTLLSLLKVILARHAGRTDIAVGTPVAGRDRGETENLIGLFLNMLVLRTDLSGNPTFRELLARVRSTALGAYEHQELPFEKLVEELNPRRDPSRPPLFQVLFNKLIIPMEDNPREVEDPKIAAEFDLDVSIYEREDGIQVSFAYNTALFLDSTIERMASHFETMLRAVVANPDTPILDLPMLSEAERQQQLVEWNQTEMDYERGSTLSELLTAQAARTPDRVALTFEGRSLTYRELDKRANQLAHYLLQRGVGPKVLVGLCIERGPDMLVGMLGILKTGGAYVPLDPAYPTNRIAFMLEDSEAPVLVTQESLRGSLPEHNAQLVSLDGDAALLDREPVEAPPLEPGAEHPAYVIYTSGSTGKPKGVQVPHRAVVNFLHAMAHTPGLGPDDVLVAVTTLSFDIAALELLLPLFVGAHLVIASRQTATDGRELAQLLESAGATAMQATPATWRMLVDSGWTGRGELSIFCGGEALPRDLAEALLTRGRRVWNLYGPTETTIWSTVFEVTSGQGSVPIGRPIGNTRVYVLDERDQPVPIGVAGELCIGGEGVTLGYLKRPELSDERFIADPFSDALGAKLYRTGDRVRFLPDGNLEHLGRLDHQVKLRGFRIELGEIEATLRTHADLAQAAVIIREDNPGDQRLTAYVVSTAGPDSEAASDHDLRLLLRESLPEYMVPSAFVWLPDLPLTPNGKLDRNALPAPERAALVDDYVAPRTPAETLLADLWCQALDLERVGVHDQFFDCGGHSLLAIQVISRFEAKTDHRLNLIDFFQQTLAQLAASAEPSSAPVDVAAPSAQYRLEPFFLDSHGRRLFALARIATRPRGRCVLFCPPHAHEYERSHRAHRELALRLAKRGFHVLTFDYSGSGDSEGSYENARLADWTAEVATAMDAAKDRFGLDRLSVVGTRLGATLALAAAANRTDIDAMALWHPIVEGASLVRDYRHLAAGLHKATSAALDVYGYPLSAALASDLESIDASSSRLPAGARAIVLENAGEGAGSLRAFSAGLAETAEYQGLGDAGVWDREVFESVVPVATLDIIAGWFDEALQ